MAKSKLLRNALILLVVLSVWELLSFAVASLLITRTPLSHADAIVVLSGGSVFQERIKWAAHLYQQGIAAKIILTNDNQQGGWSNSLQRNPFFYETARDQLFELGVPKDAVEVLSQPVMGTQDEALLLKSYCIEHQLKSILIVTSAYHSRRAKRTFNRSLGPLGIVVGVEPVPIKRLSVVTWWLQANGWKTVPLEYAKLVYYWVYY